MSHSGRGINVVITVHNLDIFVLCLDNHNEIYYTTGKISILFWLFVHKYSIKYNQLSMVIVRDKAGYLRWMGIHSKEK